MQITPHVYMLDSSIGSHVYLVLTPEPVVIDTGLGFAGKGMAHELSALCKPEEIAHILVTHHDADHIGKCGAAAAADRCSGVRTRNRYPIYHGRKATTQL